MLSSSNRIQLKRNTNRSCYQRSLLFKGSLLRHFPRPCTKPCRGVSRMFKAAFIGLDKYQDPDIRELTGARRDAQALCALFNDTIADIESTLLIDEEATNTKVRSALDNTLGAAGSEDIVVLSFS